MHPMAGLLLAAAVSAPAPEAPVGPGAEPPSGGPGVPAQHALRFDGVDDYVTFGTAPSLGASTFTLEVWFKRQGSGQSASSGSGGVVAVPLLTKGRSEVDGDNRDANYFLGIRASDSVLVADFEEGTGQAEPGLNHPIAGITPLQRDVWHQAAASFDGTHWRLLLDGVIEQETTLAPGRLPQAASIQHAGLGSALNSTGVPAGFFDGVLDEPRIWNVGRSAQGIRDSMGLELEAAPGLVGRWSLDEGSGASAGSTVDGAPTGALVNGPTWVEDSPFIPAPNHPPNAPVPMAPADGATGVSTSPSLDVRVSDPEATQPLTVTYYGRPAPMAPGPDFTLILLPDTQYYSGGLNGGSPALFKAQTQWIVDQMVARNIVDVVHVGDCVQNGDNGGNPIEWMRADTAMKTIENPATTHLPSGLPYGVCVGNHDQTPNGDASGSTALYNQYFGIARFAGRPYYGGHFGSSNDDHYHLFSASGLDFIVVFIEYDTTPDADVLAWAHDVIATHANRRAIVVSHYIINAGNPGSFGVQGQAIYDALKDLPNLFLMLCGHVTTPEGRRQDTFNGHTVNTLLSNYQERTNGGDGWLRIYEFSPANNVIRARTYSPTLGQFETDPDSSSQFTVPYDMSQVTPFQVLGAMSGVGSGTTESLPWTGLAGGRAYQWYVTVTDGAETVTGPTWRFTTGGDAPPTVTLTAPNGGESWGVGTTHDITWSAGDDQGVTRVDLALSTDGGASYPTAITSGLANSGSYSWTVPVAVTGSARVRATAWDASGQSAADASDANFSIAGPGSSNFVGNPGFETDLSGWAAYGDASLSRVSGGRSGSYALQLDSPSTAIFGVDDMPNWITATTAKNAVYRFTAWARSATSRSKVRIRIDELLNGVPQGSTATSTEVTLSSNWQQLKLSYTVRATGSTLSFRITETPSTSNRTFLVDDASIVLVSSPGLALEPVEPGDDAAAAAGATPAFAALLAPNPVHGTALLALSTTREGSARIRVFDLAGRQIAVPLDERSLPPGRHVIPIGSAERSLSPGLYFYRVDATEGSLHGRFVVMR